MVLCSSAFRTYAHLVNLICYLEICWEICCTPPTITCQHARRKGNQKSCAKSTPARNDDHIYFNCKISVPAEIVLPSYECKDCRKLRCTSSLPTALPKHPQKGSSNNTDKDYGHHSTLRIGIPIHFFYFSINYAFSLGNDKDSSFQPYRRYNLWACSWRTWDSNLYGCGDVDYCATETSPKRKLK